MPEIVIVTGASSGIGAATARLLGAAGAAVVVNYRGSRDLAENVVVDVKAAGGRAIAVAADMGREADIVRLFAETDKAFGPLTGLVNNAAINTPSPRTIADYTFQEIMDILAVNTAGVLIACREAVKRMSTKHGGKGGSIVNVSSIGALTGSPGRFIHYGGSKAAVDTMTMGLAAEVVRDGIRVNGVRPGLIDTDMHASGGEPGRIQRLQATVPLARGGTADEVAAAVLWLLSDEASYATGTFIDVSGGR